MQLVRGFSTAVLCLLYGAIVPLYAQRDHQGEDRGKVERQQGRRQTAAPSSAQKQHPQGQQQQSQARGQREQKQRQEPQQRVQQQQQPQPLQQTQQQRSQQQGQRSQQARQPQPPRRTEQQAVAWQKQRGWLQHGGWQGNNSWQRSRAQQWEHEHRTWAQRGGYGGYYIPQDRFRLYFGKQHWFRVHSRPIFYMGYPRFSYGGFSFLLVDPWPEYWAENWYEADDVYIDYDDGYYLCNRRSPSVRLAITVVM